MIKDIEQIQVSTICPICSKTISDIWIAKLDSVIGIRYAYICTECKNLLKISKERVPEFSNSIDYICSTEYNSEKTIV